MRINTLLLTIFGIGLYTTSFSQVQWSFTSKKMADSLFEIHLTAKIEKGWHLYSQMQPPEAIAEPAAILFDQSHNIQLQGDVAEKGNKELYENKVLGVKAYQYKSEVDFIQIIKLVQVKTANIKGHISFMLCNETECLPSEIKTFSLELF